MEKYPLEWPSVTVNVFTNEQSILLMKLSQYQIYANVCYVNLWKRWQYWMAINNRWSICSQTMCVFWTLHQSTVIHAYLYENVIHAKDNVIKDTTSRESTNVCGRSPAISIMSGKIVEMSHFKT